MTQSFASLLKKVIPASRSRRYPNGLRISRPTIPKPTSGCDIIISLACSFQHDKTIDDGRWIQMEGGGVMCDKCWKNMYLPKVSARCLNVCVPANTSICSVAAVILRLKSRRYRRLTDNLKESTTKNALIAPHAMYAHFRYTAPPEQF